LRERQELEGERLAIIEVKVTIHHETNVTQGEECDRLKLFSLKKMKKMKIYYMKLQ
jgi:hypothetical protein